MVTHILEDQWEFVDENTIRFVRGQCLILERQKEHMYLSIGRNITPERHSVHMQIYMKQNMLAYFTTNFCDNPFLELYRRE